jgi:hypothetical protein
MKTSTATDETLPLFTLPSDDRKIIRINANVSVEEIDDVCVVWVAQRPWHRFKATSKLDRRIVGANLVLAGLAKTVDVVRGLEINRDTLHRDRKRLLEGGLPALASVRRGPQGPSKATPALQTRARQYYRQGLSKSEIGRRLGLTEGTIRRILADEEPREPSTVQLPLLSEETETESRGVVDTQGETDTENDTEDEHSGTPPVETPIEEGDPEATNSNPSTSAIEDTSAFVSPVPHREETTERDLDRTTERIMARFGLLSEAEVCYVPGDNLRSVGGLLIIPALVATGFFAGVESVYGNLKNGFYGLRHTVMTVALMLTLRVKRAEHLTRISPTALGRLLGLDRAPEVKTLRRRLREIARQGKADELMRWFAKHLAEEDPDVLGFLYVDGHTRIYYGKRKISKAYSTRKRLALPAVTDFWVHDTNGQPFFVVTGEVNQSLTKQLLPLVEELKGLLSPERRLTFIFDRGGWSPKLFKKLFEAGCDFITYRKGKCRRYPAKDFTVQASEVGETKVSYLLRDGLARFGVGMQFRQIVRREKDGHQIAIVTSRKELPAAEVVFRLGERWRQENYFKYVREEFALDALDSHQVEAEDPERTIPNPKRKPLDKKIRALRKKIETLEAELGRAADTNEESRRRTVRGLKIAHGPLRQELAKIREKRERLIERRKKLPTRVTIEEASGDEAVLLEVEHKHFMNAVKMAVYRAESSLLQRLAPHYSRSEDEGRALLREAFLSSGSLAIEGDALRVTLDPMSAPRRTRAVAALCQQLNEADVRIPGTTLRLRFSVSRETGVSEMAMGPCQEV